MFRCTLALLLSLVLSVVLSAQTITWTPSPGDVLYTITAPERGALISFGDEDDVGAVLDGGPTLALFNGSMEHPVELLTGTVVLDGWPQGNGTFDVEIPFGTAWAAFVRPRSLRVPNGTGEAFRDFLMLRFPDGRGVAYSARLAPNPMPIDLDETGSGVIVAQAPPMFVSALTTGSLDAAQVAEIERVLRARLKLSVYHYWTEQDWRPVTALECLTRGWIMGSQGYRAKRYAPPSDSRMPDGVSSWPKGGGWALGLYSSPLPPGVAWVATRNGVPVTHGESGNPGANAAHFTVTPMACVSLFTGDQVASASVVGQIEALMSLYPHERFMGDARGHGLALHGLGVAYATQAPYQPAFGLRLVEYVNIAVSRLEYFNRTGPGGSWWPVLAEADNAKVPRSAFYDDVCEVYGADPQNASRSVRTFMLAILVDGATKALDLIPAAALSSPPTSGGLTLFQRLNRQWKGASSTLVDTIGSAVHLDPNGQMFLEPTYMPRDIGLGVGGLSGVRFGVQGNHGGSVGVAPRFVLPVLAELWLHGISQSSHTEEFGMRIVDYCEQAAWFNAGPTDRAKLSEYMGPVWEAGWTTFGLQ